jgi:hypothetical protein
LFPLIQASRHFKQRLIETLANAGVESRLFRCPECSQDFKTRINLWTHYLGKHRYGEKWTQELLASQAAIKKENVAADLPSAISVWDVARPKTPTQSLVASSVAVKTEAPVTPIKTEVEFPDEEKVKTPKKSRQSFDSSMSVSGGGKSLNFWCDLCQFTVSSSSRIPHFANVHFESRLKTTLPSSGHFSCPLCRHEGKNFLNLSIHFLGKHHEYMRTW